jgi:hypothetical protein
MSADGEGVKTPTESSGNGKLRLLTKQEIYGADDTLFEDVDVPEWKGAVRVYGLTGTERDSFEASMIEGTGKNQTMNTQNIRAKLCALAIRDENGKPMFDMGDINTLGQKSAAALDRVYEVAARLSKISKEDVDELAKNSGKGRSRGS